MERIRKYEPLWGSWKVKRKIGEGSFGAVYEAEKTVAGNTSYSAVKLISFNNSDILRGIKLDETISADRLDTIKEETAKKNIREAALMDKLQGRANIVTIHDYEIYTNEKTTDVLIRMELLTNLRESIEAAKIDTDFVIKFGIDICRALESCEKENIIHRDIKPENIFINKDGDFKLGDFGLSRQMSKSASMSLRKAKGTPLYMSPEAFGWGQHVDNTSDIYSLGIVMYQLLNDGKIPFCEEKDDFEEEDNAIGRRLDGEEITPPLHGGDGLWEVIKKACQFKKEDRYQSASEIRKDLEELKHAKNIVIKCNVGDTITFGSYPQDEEEYDDYSNKPIEWLVLKKEENRMLVISKYLLEGSKYHKKREPVTWETSDIRFWLNEFFYKKAFNDEERKKILISLVEASNNPKYNTDPGKNTKDKIFLLSINEAKSLFGSEKERKGYATDYALNKWLQVSGLDEEEFVEGLYVIDDDEYFEDRVCDWTLRSPGMDQETVAFVNSAGCLFEEGEYVDVLEMGIRPAMWISLES